MIPVNREQQFGVHQLAADTLKRPHPWQNPKRGYRAEIQYISLPCLINYVCPRNHQRNCSLMTSKHAARRGSVCENHDWELNTSGKDSHGTVGDTYDLVVDTIRCHRYIHIDHRHRCTVVAFCMRESNSPRFWICRDDMHGPCSTEWARHQGKPRLSKA